MAKKMPVIWNGTTMHRDASFSRGLIVSDYKELFFLTGQLDSDAQGNCRHPGHPVGQAKGILDSLTGMLEQEGWSLHDVIMLDLTVTKDVDPRRTWTAYIRSGPTPLRTLALSPRREPRG